MIQVFLFALVTVRTWWNANPPAENVTSYNVYIDGAWLGETNQLTKTFTGIDNSRRRCFVVTATNSKGEGPASDPYCIDPPASSSSSVAVSSSGSSSSVLAKPVKVSGVGALVVP